jgi:hypothetical protein
VSVDNYGLTQVDLKNVDHKENPWVLADRVAQVFHVLSYPVFMPKQSTHRMQDSGSIVPHIWPQVFTDNQMSQIKYNYYMNSVSKDYDNSQWNGIAEDSTTPQERQPG